MLADRTRRFGSEPIFATQPSYHYRRTDTRIEGQADTSIYSGHEMNGVDHCRMMRRMDAALEEVSRSKHATFIDLSADYQWEESDFYDFLHMTPSGARKPGDCLFKELNRVVVVGT